MNKKIILLAFTTVLNFFVFAQVKKNTVDLSKNNQHLKVFNQAIVSGDAATAIIALNYFVAEQGGNSTYADTLAMLYAQQGEYTQCYYWTDKRLKVKPDDTNLMELKAVCLDKLQQPKEAIDIFEKLFRKTNSPYHAYKLMELQYSIKRLAECLATAQAAEKLTYKPEYTMTYNVGQQVGRTYLQAGVYNIHALALYDLDKKAESKIYLERAIALDSSFLLAKQNLEALMTMQSEPKKNANPTIQQPITTPANKQD